MDFLLHLASDPAKLIWAALFVTIIVAVGIWIRRIKIDRRPGEILSLAEQVRRARDANPGQLKYLLIVVFSLLAITVIARVITLIGVYI